MKELIVNQDEIKKKLTKSNTWQDLEDLGNLVARILQDKNLSENAKKEWQKLRQRIYEKKHACKGVISANMSTNRNLWNVLKDLLFLFIYFFLLYVSWEQSCYIYKNLGMAQFYLVGLAGTIITIIPIYLSKTLKKKFLVILIGFILAYELVLMVAGTFVAEENEKELLKKQDIQYHILLEEYNNSGQEYQEYKKRLNEAGSKVFNNPWFKKKYVDASWEKMSSNVQKIKEFETSFGQGIIYLIRKYLKVMFRLLLVVVLMMSTVQIEVIFGSKRQLVV